MVKDPEYGTRTICMYDENENNEFKAFSFFETKPVLREQIILKCKPYKSSNPINLEIKREVEYFFRENKIIKQCIESMINKYLCTYISCFYNNINNIKPCNLYFGINDSGIEVGVPFYKGDGEFETYIRKIVKNRLKYCIDNNMLILINEDPAKQRSIRDILHCVTLSIKKIANPSKKSYFSNDDRLRISVKERNSNNKCVENYNKTLEMSINKHYNKILLKNEKIFELLYESFRSYSYWENILNELGIDNIHNVELYSYFSTFREKFIIWRDQNGDVIDFINDKINIYVNEISNSIIEKNLVKDSYLFELEKHGYINENHSNITLQNIKTNSSDSRSSNDYSDESKVIDDDNKKKKRKRKNKNSSIKQYCENNKKNKTLLNICEKLMLIEDEITKLENYRNKANLMINHLGDVATTRLVRKYYNKQQILNNSPHPDKVFLSYYNENVLDKISRIVANTNSFKNKCIKSAAEIHKENLNNITINNFEYIVRYVTDIFDLYIIRVTIDLSDRRDGDKLYFSENPVDIRDEQVYVKESSRTRQYLSNEISCSVNPVYIKTKYIKT